MSLTNKLESQINEARRTISSDGYPMSIGELTNLYKNKELIIRPEFQRLFRWKNTQKSRLIESLLLGIPLPSIFVSQNQDGTWEVVDGLQRISTILQLQGELLAEDDNKIDMLVMEGTKYLPALEGRVWHSNNPNTSLSDAQRLDIKRAKIDVKIIKRESSSSAKYDLFQRLNSYGSTLTSQELRSALIVAVSADFFKWLEDLSSNEYFKECTQLGDRLIEERYDLELVTRFIVLHNWPQKKLNQSLLRDLSQVLDEEAIKLASADKSAWVKLEGVFNKTFKFISENGGADVFRKWDPNRNDFRGSFLNSGFEIFGLGVGFNIANKNVLNKYLIDAAKVLWSTPEMRRGFVTGKSTEFRLVNFIPEGRRITQG